MIRIAICEDDRDFALELESVIFKKFFQYNLDCKIDYFSTGETLLDAIENNDKDYDIIFFDIELPGLDGIEVARKIREVDNEAIFIFITYLNEKVYEALNLNIFHFIRKGHFHEEIDSILHLLIKRLDYLVQRYPFPIDGEDIYFTLYDILYFEILDRKLVLHTEKDSYISSYRSLKNIPLKNIPFELVENQFFEAYRGIAVNLNHVKNLIDNKIYLSNGTILCIARRRLKTFKEKFYKYISAREGIL